MTDAGQQKQAYKNIVLRESANAYGPIVEFLAKNHSYEVYNLGKKAESIRSKVSYGISLVWQTVRLFAVRKRLRDCDTIFSVGYVTIPLKLFARLGLFNYRKCFWFGFFVHSTRWDAIFRLQRLLDTEKDHYILLTEFEVELYANRFGIRRDCLHYFPYGHWDLTDESSSIPPAGVTPFQYYFSGGYSNRDYVPLIEIFRKLDVPLVVICSRLNTEIDSIPLPSNVTVLRDVSLPKFRSYLRHSKACIIPLKEDTGISGVSVILQAMRFGRLIIVSDMGVIRGYVENGKSGYVLKDFKTELPPILANIEKHPDLASRFGEEARSQFEARFSRTVGSVALWKILERN